MHLVRDDLRDLPLFAGAKRSELVAIRRQLTELHVRAGKVLVHEGARGDEFMILVEGEAVVTQGGRPIATLGRGDLVGEMALLQQHGRGRRNATVTAVTDLVLYAGSPSEFRRILEAAPSVAEKVRETAASRVTPQAA
ncbi:MAG TPA: cyclic nucleotide-binding domain-containing protein [Acidimicrobiales bacterium]|nr:cyclic nucleotide-binding domain-containing protein [Acidimicrobiales bacterium]